MKSWIEQYKERQEDFSQAYEDFETSEVVKLVKAAGLFLEHLTGETTAVDKAMKVLFAVTANYPTADTRPWADYWDEARLDVGSFNTSNYFLELNAYGFYGLAFDASLLETPVSPAEETERRKLCQEFVKRGRDLVDCIPSGWSSIEGLETTVRAAEARFNLDFGNDITIEQLAAIARVSTKSIRNLLTPKSGEADLKGSSNGTISAADALRWLQRREDFKHSIWREADGKIDISFTPETGELQEAVFVPVAKDGTAFDPVMCRNSRGYTIGPKGAEQPVNDYFEALRLLAKAVTPNWRRPNESGNWGIVVGVSWQRKDAAELKKLLQGSRI